MKYISPFLIALLFLIACQPDTTKTPTEKASLFSNTQNEIELAEKRLSPVRKAAGLVGNTVVKVDYSSPQVNDRIIWGGLVPYEEVWRTGANEATVISFEKAVLIEDQKLAAGKYSIYSIPGEKKWTIIFNYIWEQWGTEYNEAQDALRITVSPQNLNSFVEGLEIDVDEPGLLIRWEKLQIPVKLAPAPEET